MIKKFTLFLFAFSLMLGIHRSYAQDVLKSSSYENLISDYLKDNKTKYSFEDQDISDLVVTDEYFSNTTEITHIYVNQRYQGIRIFNAISSVAIKNDAVFYYANRFLKGVENKVNSTEPNYAPLSAIQKVASEYQLGSTQGIVQIERNGTRYQFTKGLISSENIDVELVFVNQPDGLRLAWDLLIYATNSNHWWNARVDAITNEIIEIKDLILTCTFEKEYNHSEVSYNQNFFNTVSGSTSILNDGSSYNVFPLPIESPNHGSRQIISEPASSSASPFGWHDVDGFPGAEFTTARGNNVWAKEDILGNNSATGFSPNGTSNLNFDFPLDFNLAPAQYQEAAITNLFYLNNMMHDIWFNHGFDESAGNFQAKNYSNMGQENDFVLADAQDGSGFNNANFGTPADGFNPRMQMFLWSPPGGNPNDRMIVQNGTLVGDYSGIGAGFGEDLSSTPVTANLVLAIDTTPDFYNACQQVVNSAALNGNIAILRRGDCEFGAKVLAVENAGAIAAIVVNNVSGPVIEMGPGADGDAVSIPSIMVSQGIGESLITALSNGESIITTLLGPDLTDYIDGDFDNGIIAHEYGHGISNRLTGGPSSVFCLQNDEQMGEGWSDWFGLMVTLSETDIAEDARGIGTFAVSQPVTGQGIRPAQYSTDFGINGFTFSSSNTLAQPHGIGFVWATALWDLTWAYIDKYGFDSDLYNGNGGNNRVMKLVINGLKLQPCTPGFIDGRDALLAADMATTGGVDQCMIWEVFAARGLGFNAQQGDSANRSDQIEDFSLPPSSDVSLVNCSSLSNTEFSKDSLTIYPNPTQTELSITTKENFGYVLLTLFDVNGRKVFEQEYELFDTIKLNTSQFQTGLYILNIKGEALSYNTKIIKN